MLFEENESLIKLGHQTSDEFDPASLKTITINEKEGITGITGCLKGSSDERKTDYI